MDQQEQNHEKAEQIYMQLQMLQQQIKQIQQQMEAVEQHLMEATVAKHSIDELKNTKIGSEILVPVTSGIFVKATLLDSSEVLMNVGSKTVVAKGMDKAKELIQSQLTEMKEVQQKMGNDLQEMIMQARMLEQEMQKLVG